MGALCVANKKNLAVREENHIAVKCKILLPNTNQPFITHYKPSTSIEAIKVEIAKKLKKDKKAIFLEIKGKTTTYGNLQLSHLVQSKYDEVELKVVEGPNPNKKDTTIIEKDKESNLNTEKDKDLKNFNSNNSKTSTEYNIKNVNILDEQSVIFMSKVCNIHDSRNGKELETNENVENEKEKLTMICQTCGQGICSICLDEFHKEHVVVNKIDIVEFRKTLLENQQTLNSQFHEMNIEKDHNEIIKDFKLEMKKFSDLFSKMIQEIKKKEEQIIENFKKNIDMFLPSIICYRDNLIKVNLEYEKNLNKIISDDKIFMQFYLDYILLSNQVTKSAENIGNLKSNLAYFNYCLEDYQKRTKDISDIVRENYYEINKYNTTVTNDYFNYNIESELAQSQVAKSPRRANSNDYTPKSPHLKSNLPINNTSFKPSHLMSLKDLIEFQSKNLSITSNMQSMLNSNLGGNSNTNNLDFKQDMENRINLRSLMQTPNKAISGLIKKQKKKKTLLEPVNQNENQLDIITEFNSTGKEKNPDYIFNFKEGSNSIFMFKTNDSTLSVQTCKFENKKISEFENHYSSLNYLNHFYVSGNGYGLGSVNSFMQLDVEDDFTMKEITKMPTLHSFHGMLGVYNSLLVISGTQSQKIEQYNIITKKWISLPTLHFSRTWPSSIFVDKAGIFIFGGMIEQSTPEGELAPETNNNSESFTLKIEKLDFKFVKKFYDLTFGNIETELIPVPNEELDPSYWEILNIKFDQSYLPIYSGFLFLQNPNNESSGNILILGGKLSQDDYESEDKILNLDLESLTVKEETFILNSPDEFDGRLFIKYTKNEKNENDEEVENTYYAQFSSVFPKRVHIYSHNKMEISEYGLKSESSYQILDGLIDSK